MKIFFYLCILSKDCLYPETRLEDARLRASEVENGSKETLINKILTELETVFAQKQAIASMTTK